jgi:hypothetical protein
MNGKGDRNRITDYKTFNKNYDKIRWGNNKNKKKSNKEK